MATQLNDKYRIAKYNCFVYAFGLDTDLDFIYFFDTEPKRNINSDSICYLIKYCILIPVETAERGDYIFYKKRDKFTHAGIVLDKNIIISKWGTEDPSIKRHRVEDAFTEYGSNIYYYKRVSAEKIKEQWIK